MPCSIVLLSIHFAIGKKAIRLGGFDGNTLGFNAQVGHHCLGIIRSFVSSRQSTGIDERIYITGSSDHRSAFYPITSPAAKNGRDVASICHSTDFSEAPSNDRSSFPEDIDRLSILYILSGLLLNSQRRRYPTSLDRMVRCGTIGLPLPLLVFTKPPTFVLPTFFDCLHSQHHTIVGKERRTDETNICDDIGDVFCGSND